jgi:beta-N-acetylhexosaminidase
MLSWTDQQRLAAAGAVLLGLLTTAACSSDPAPPASPSPPPPSASAPASATSSASPAVSPAVSPSPTSTSTCVATTLAQLTAAQKAGQLVMSGVPAASPSSGRPLVRDRHLGGVFLAGRTSRSPASLHRDLARLTPVRTRGARIGLLVAVDQEGGAVQALRGGSWTAIPSGRTQGRWTSARLRSRTRTWARELKEAGVTMDLAPVADTVPAGTASANPPIGRFDRQYGSTPAAVADDVATVTSALDDADVIATVKHFPGLGRVKANTDTSTAAVDTSTTPTSSYLRPFRDGIEAGAGAVMVSSARYRRIDPSHQAVFSSIVITDLLRERLGFEGVVMTDDVGQAVAVRSVPAGERATRFIAAGGDLVLSVVPGPASAMVRAIARKAAADKEFRAQVDASVTRVLRLKEQAGLLDCS